MKISIYASIVLGLACIFTTVTTYDSQALPVDKSLVLYLPFEEGSGDTTEDLSQYGHEANLVNDPKWVDGQYGKALEFDGTNYVIIPINDDLQLRETFTAEFWVKRDASQAAGWNYMVAAGELRWAVIYNTDQKGYIYTRSGGTWAQRIVTSIPLTEDWTHIAATYDVNKGVTLYFNAEEAGTGAKPPVVDEIDGSIMVGARHPGSEFFTGVIDDVVLYNRIISLDEIKQDMEGVGGAAVSPSDKLTSTWGKIKNY